MQHGVDWGHMASISQPASGAERGGLDNLLPQVTSDALLVSRHISADGAGHIDFDLGHMDTHATESMVHDLSLHYLHHGDQT